MDEGAAPATARHVAGRAARGKADARRPPGSNPRFDLSVRPERRVGNNH